MKEQTRKLAVIMFTDIVGYTALMQADEAEALRIRTRHREVFEQAHDKYHGEILQYYGDGTLSIFKSAVEAVHCAIEMQQAFTTNDPQVPVRIGMHLGDVIHSGTEIYGDGVNIAARIEQLSRSGAIFLSAKIREELHNHKNITTVSLGHFELKNVINPVEVHAIANHGIHVPASDEMRGKKPKLAPKSIAVLPFVNMSADPANEFFSDGMTEEIINALTKIRGLKVTSRTSSFYFKNKQLPATTIGKELDVATILEGSVRLAGQKMRITVQLIDVADDFHFWSETFDRSVEDVFAVQDEVSLLIADRLREHVGHFEIEDQLVQNHQVPYEMYLKYLKSRYHMLKMSKKELDKGIEILENVLLKYPDYPLAHLGVHMGYTLMGTIGYMPVGEAFARGKAHLDQAIRLDDKLPECQLQQAWISFLQDWNLEATYQHLNKVLETRPMVDYYQTMASTLVAEKKFKAAHNYIETAFQLDPFSEINYHLKGYILYLEEKYQDSIFYFKKSVQLKQGSQVSLIYWGQALLLQNKPEDAYDFFAQLPDQTGLLKVGGLTMANAALGKYDAALQGINELKTHLNSDLMDRAANLLILCYTMMKDHDAAIDMIEKSIRNRLPMMVYLEIEPMVKPLLEIPRFQQLMKQIFGEVKTQSIKTGRYKKSLLNKNTLNKYHHKLLDLMKSNQPYLDPLLTLRDLAEMLNLPPNHLSQLLNEGFDQNFSEFINSYRLEAFKTRLADPASKNLTILAIAYESGFNSKTVFNTYFKKATGQTPKSYLRTLN